MKNIYFVGAPTDAKGIADFNYIADTIHEANFHWFCYKISDDIKHKYKRINFKVGLDDANLKKSIKQEMDIFISCSYFEGFCLPIAEALLLKKPVISYNLEEIKDTYENNITYVTLGDKDGLVRKLNECIQQGPSEKILNTAKQFIEENYSPSIVSEKLLKCVLN